MARVGVVAHREKSLGGGLAELRAALADAGIDDPIWYEVGRSGKAPKRVRRCVEEGADVVIIWGGDGMVRRAIDAIVECGGDAALAIVPAGTANLLASNLGIPRDVRAAVGVALGGHRRRLDVGEVVRGRGGQKDGKKDGKKG